MLSQPPVGRCGPTVSGPHPDPAPVGLGDFPKVRRGCSKLTGNGFVTRQHLERPIEHPARRGGRLVGARLAGATLRRQRERRPLLDQPELPRRLPYTVSFTLR